MPKRRTARAQRAFERAKRASKRATRSTRSTDNRPEDTAEDQQNKWQERYEELQKLVSIWEFESQRFQAALPTLRRRIGRVSFYYLYAAPNPRADPSYVKCEIEGLQLNIRLLADDIASLREECVPRAVAHYRDLLETKDDLELDDAPVSPGVKGRTGDDGCDNLLSGGEDDIRNNIKQLLHSIEECTAYIKEAKLKKKGADTPQESTASSSPRHDDAAVAVLPASPSPAADDASKHVLYMFGGRFAEPYHWAETFDGQEWNTLPWAPPKATYARLGLVLQGQVFSIGGMKSYDNPQMLRTVECYNPRDNCWEARASLPVDYEDLTGAVLHDRLYVLLCDKEMNNTLLLYDQNANQWKVCCAPTRGRTRARLVAWGDCLYLIGGRDYECSLHRVDRYDPERNKWVPTAMLNQARHDFSAQVFRDKLYVIGGTDIRPDGTELELKEVECYDPQVKQWRPVGDLQTPRSRASAFVLHHCLHVAGGVVGGDRTPTLLASVERFDEATGEWSESKPMANKRWQACCAVLAFEPR